MERVATLGDLDGGLLVDAEEGDVGHPDEGPLLAGPELHHGPLLRGLGGRVEVGEAHAAQVGGQADEDVPERYREKRGERREERRREEKTGEE